MSDKQTVRSDCRHVIHKFSIPGAESERPNHIVRGFDVMMFHLTQLSNFLADNWQLQRACMPVWSGEKRLNTNITYVDIRT